MLIYPNIRYSKFKAKIPNSYYNSLESPYDKDKSVCHSLLVKTHTNWKYKQRNTQIHNTDLFDKMRYRLINKMLV